MLIFPFHEFLRATVLAGDDYMNISAGLMCASPVEWRIIAPPMYCIISILVGGLRPSTASRVPSCSRYANEPMQLPALTHNYASFVRDVNET